MYKRQVNAETASLACDRRDWSWLRSGLTGNRGAYTHDKGCLLYTSDAADERSSVDLGGRRIIKKKKKEDSSSPVLIYK